MSNCIGSRLTEGEPFFVADEGAAAFGATVVVRTPLGPPLVRGDEQIVTAVSAEALIDGRFPSDADDVNDDQRGDDEEERSKCDDGEDFEKREHGLALEYIRVYRSGR